jgi:hypothetical protein
MEWTVYVERMGNTRCIQHFSRKSEGRAYLGRLGVDRRIILKSVKAAKAWS